MAAIGWPCGEATLRPEHPAKCVDRHAGHSSDLRERRAQQVFEPPQGAESKLWEQLPARRNGHKHQLHLAKRKGERSVGDSLNGRHTNTSPFAPQSRTASEYPSGFTRAATVERF